MYGLILDLAVRKCVWISDGKFRPPLGAVTMLRIQPGKASGRRKVKVGITATSRMQIRRGKVLERELDDREYHGLLRRIIAIVGRAETREGCNGEEVVNNLVLTLSEGDAVFIRWRPHDQWIGVIRVLDVRKNRVRLAFLGDQHVYAVNRSEVLAARFTSDKYRGMARQFGVVDRKAQTHRLDSRTGELRQGGNRVVHQETTTV